MGVKLVKFEVIDFHKAYIVGKMIHIKNDPGRDDNSIPSLWDSIISHGELEELQKHKGCISHSDRVGWMGDYLPADDTYNYIAGVFFDITSTIPGYEYRIIEQTKMAIAWIQETDDGNDEDIHTDASAYMRKALEQNQYEYDFSKGAYEIEYYSYQRLIDPNIKNGSRILDFYTPCKKK